MAWVCAGGIIVLVYNELDREADLRAMQEEREALRYEREATHKFNAEVITIQKGVKEQLDKLVQFGQDSRAAAEAYERSLTLEKELDNARRTNPD